MEPSTEQTPLMGEPERERARQLTLSRLRPPRRVAGYEQERFIGRGSFGEVWVAVDSNNGRKVAIKFFHRRGGLDWSLLSREVEKLRHLFGDRHVVQLLQVGWESDPPYYVMEYMESGSVEDLLRDGPLPVDRALALFRGVATGLAHAHGKGILHCDLKPANVMLDQDGQPRLADFGQARLSHEHSPALGTLFYMAPEQADMKAVPDVRWDVYALGAVAYRMLTGEAPYRTPEGLAAVKQAGPLEERLGRYRRFLAKAPRPAAHRDVPGVDPALAAVIDRCLAVDLAKRYPNVQAVLSALDTRAAQRARRPLLILGGVGPLLVLLVLFAVGGYELRRMIGSAEKDEMDRARDLNRLVARAEADRLGWEIAFRRQVLEKEATSPEIRNVLSAPPPVDMKTGPGVAELNRWLLGRQHFWGDRGGPALLATNWIVLDRGGYIRACTETIPDRPGRAQILHEVLGVYFGYRTYFHGRPLDMPKTGGPPAADPPHPIRQPHRSAVYLQYPSKVYAVGYSTPVRPADPRDPNPLGVLAVISELVGPTRVQGGDGRDRFLVLVDTGLDSEGRLAPILRHPYQEAFKDDLTRLPLVYAPGLIGKAGGDAGPYTDPVGEGSEDWRRRFAVPWLAAIEPVSVPVIPDGMSAVRQRDSGLVVVVQETEAGVVEPIRSLRSRLVWRAALAVLLITLLLAGLWLLVLVVLDAAPGSRVIRFLRRQVGFRTAGSGSVSGSGGSGPGSGQGARGAGSGSEASSSVPHASGSGTGTGT
ncbi:MAG: serine/threonine-protein kinase [Gemmataceae bacterium]